MPPKLPYGEAARERCSRMRLQRLNVSQSVILRVLQYVRDRVGRPIHRTQLVKLIYLVDYMYARHTGRTLTGFMYMWDKYGPNAVGHAIAAEAGKLVNCGLLNMKVELTEYGDYVFRYVLAGEVEETPPLDDLGEAIVEHVVDTYGHMSVQRLTAASKRTPPFREARQGEVLNLRADPRKARILELVAKRAAEGYYEDTGEGVPIEELKARYGLP